MKSLNRYRPGEFSTKCSHMKSGDKKMVMIVEDDAVLRRGLARLFADDMFEVVQFDDGSRAFEAISERMPDLILCDYRLPGMDGLEMLSRLRGLGIEVPFILITAHYSEQMEEAATEQGAAAVIEKPFDIIQLKELCRRLLSINRRTAGNA